MFKKPLSNKLLISISLILAFILTLCSIFYVTTSYYDIYIEGSIERGGIPVSGVGYDYGFPFPWVRGHILDYRPAPYEGVFYHVNPFSFMIDCFFWWIIASIVVYTLNWYREPKYLMGKLRPYLLFLSFSIFLGLPFMNILIKTIIFIVCFTLPYILLHWHDYESL